MSFVLKVALFLEMSVCDVGAKCREIIYIGEIYCFIDWNRDFLSENVGEITGLIGL